MAKVIVFTNDAGGVSVMTPILESNAISDAGEWLPLREGQAPPEGYRYPTIEEVAAKDAPAEYIILDDSELPSRDKREGWVIVGGVVGVDESRIPKAPLAERLAEKFRGLLSQYGSMVSKQTRKEIMELEALGNRYLQFGLAEDWRQDIVDYVPSDPADQPLVAQLKQLVVQEF